MADDLLKLVDSFDRQPTENPYPEGSDYGRLWRRAYDAGKFDQQGKRIAAALRSRAASQEERMRG